MSDIIPNVVIGMPNQLFTLARRFQAASNGKIYIGKIDTDPTLPENQIQVYLENEDGSHIPVPQPLIINQAGFPVYNGQIAKFVTVEGHSMAVYDSYGTQQFYYPNVLKYDPDQFESRLLAGDGSLIGTNHRGNLALDLDAIDRRPDGYNNDIQAVLDNGNDVQINKDYEIRNRLELYEDSIVSGVGGRITVIEKATPAIFADARSLSRVMDHVRLSNIKIEGSVIDNDNAAYGVFLRDSKYPLVDGINASNFTGAIININTTSSIINNTVATKMVYHPHLGAGGYGVLLDETRQSIINGVQFEAGEGNENGRHMLYISRSGNNGNSYDGCMNTIATNMIAKYRSKNDRNMWAINLRKSSRGITDNVIIDGANSGIAYNTENGYIENTITSNVVAKIYKYQNGVGVYGVSQMYPSEGENYRVSGSIDTSMILTVLPEASIEGLNGKDCVGYSMGGINCRLSNTITNVPSSGYPILITPGVKNCVIDGVLDYISYKEDVESAFITFSGNTGSCENISVRGVKTSRKMFSRLDAVKDLTVDFQRKSRITIENGVLSKIDSHELIKEVIRKSDGLEIIFNDHVTQNAIENIYFQNIGGFFSTIKNIGAKRVYLNSFGVSGAVIDTIRQSFYISIILSS
ncbi:phage tailspike protein [Proteus mirabilis]|uniref:phage tailspike protein n=1 Tax=Proteus mirabilis TaxID=584 RepID=UPI0034D4CB1B